MKNRKRSIYVFIVVLFTLLWLNTSINANDISVEIKSAIANIATELESPLARAGLESLVYRFYVVRMNEKPMKYESEDTFKSFLGTFSVFREILWKAPLKTVVANILTNRPKAIEGMETSYDKNKEVFQRFVNKIIKKIDYFRVIPPEVILKSQIFYSIILLGGSPDTWNQARQFTYIWPFC